jgi:hypothetical protein
MPALNTRRLNTAWCVTTEEAGLLFRPGQLRAGWSRKRRTKFLRRWRRRIEPERLTTYRDIHWMSGPYFEEEVNDQCL